MCVCSPCANQCLQKPEEGNDYHKVGFTDSSGNGRGVLRNELWPSSGAANTLNGQCLSCSENYFQSWINHWINFYGHNILQGLREDAEEKTPLCIPLCTLPATSHRSNEGSPGPLSLYPSHSPCVVPPNSILWRVVGDREGKILHSCLCFAWTVIFFLTFSDLLRFFFFKID